VRVVSVSSETELRAAVEGGAPSLILLEKPLRAYQALRRASPSWHLFHVHVAGCGDCGGVVKAASALLEERAKLGGLPTRFTKSKPVSRRGFLALWRAAREGISGPLQGARARSLGRKAREALSAICPHGALGEGLDLREQRCAECGLCYSLLPAQVLESPLLPFEGVRKMLEALSDMSDPPTVVYFQLDKELEFYERAAGEPDRLVGVPATGYALPWWLPLLHYLYAVPGAVLGLSGPYLDYVLRDAKALKLGGFFSRWGESEGAGGGPGASWKRPVKVSCDASSLVVDAVSELARAGAAELPYQPLSIRSFVPIVDNDKCTLCGACARSCPYGALEMESEPRQPRLLLRMNACQGCFNCTYACPEGAILGFEPLIAYNGYRTLAYDELAKCVVCGAPVGPRRRLEKLERELVKGGMEPEKARRTVRLCAECRLRGLVEGQKS